MKNLTSTAPAAMRVGQTEIEISDLNTALGRIDPSGFTMRSLAQEIQASGLDEEVSCEAARRYLQRLSQSGEARFDTDTRLWEYHGDVHQPNPEELPELRVVEKPSAQSLNDIPEGLASDADERAVNINGDAEVSNWHTSDADGDAEHFNEQGGNFGDANENPNEVFKTRNISWPPMDDANQNPPIGPTQVLPDADLPDDKPNFEVKDEQGRWLLKLGVPVCAVTILALAFMNANFVWGFAQSAELRWILSAGFMATDLARPLMVAASLSYLSSVGLRRGWLRGGIGILIPLFLMQLSLLASTSVMSGSFQAGQAQLAQAEQRVAQEARLVQQHGQKTIQIETLRERYDEECNRGGCGTIADGIFQELRAAISDADTTLAAIEALPPIDDGQTLAAHTAKSLAAIGIGFEVQLFLIPLLMALTLELAATFGPALILTRGHRPRAN